MYAQQAGNVVIALCSRWLETMQKEAAISISKSKCVEYDYDRMQVYNPLHYHADVACLWCEGQSWLPYLDSFWHESDRDYWKESATRLKGQSPMLASI